MGNPLLFAFLSVPVVYLALGVLGRWLRRKGGVPLGWAYTLLSVCLALLTPAAWVQFHPEVERGLVAAAVMLGTIVLMDVVRKYYWEEHVRRRHGNRVPEFVRQVVQLHVLAAVVIAILYFLYGYRIPGLLAGSGIAAIILGLAVQDILGNVIAGYAVHTEKAFRPGDWLLWDQQHIQVVETSWRATRCRNNDDVHLDIPNSLLAKAVITNFSYPAPHHGMRVTIPVDRNAPPNRVKEVLVQAARCADGVLAKPVPKVFLAGFTEWSIQYEVRVWLDDHSRQNEVLDAVRTLAWYGLRRAGIGIPQPSYAIQVSRPRRVEGEEAREIGGAVLAGVPIFGPLTEGQREQLARCADRLRFGRGERIVEQGVVAGSMFVLLEGGAEVLVRGAGEERPQRVALLAPGDCFGEMSLLTGEPRNGTVRATADSVVLEIGKEDLGVVLRESPDLAEALSALAAARRKDTSAFLERDAGDAPSGAGGLVTASTVLGRLRSYFGL